MPHSKRGTISVKSTYSFGETRRGRRKPMLISLYILNGKTTPTSSTSLWSLEKLQAYYCVIKSFSPLLSTKAATILREYYHCQRQADARNVSRTTVRLLESLIRLSQAHARLMYRNEVIVQDAVVAVSLIETSCSGGSNDYNLFNAVQTSFPKDPMEEYKNQATQILTQLGLTDILDEELQFLENEFQVPLDRTEVHNERIEKDQNVQEVLQDHRKEETEMGKKLGAVLNNIRQAKNRNEHMAIAQTKAAKGKRKMESGSRRKKDDLVLEACDSSDDSSMDDDIIVSPFSKSKRKKKVTNCERKMNGTMDSLLADIEKLPRSETPRKITTSELLKEEVPVYESVFQNARSPTPERLANVDDCIEFTSPEAKISSFNEEKDPKPNTTSSSSKSSIKTREWFSKFAFKKTSLPEKSPEIVVHEKPLDSEIPKKLPITHFHSQSSFDAARLVSQSIFSMKDPSDELDELDFDI